jgi:prepilin-type processing-associated H-X9-DG protein
VELLVVIGIIALLISILMPSLQRARQAALTVTCAAQERQIGQAILMYAGENKGAIPMGYIGLPVDPPNSYSGWVVSWDDMIDPYLSQRHLTATEYGWVPSRDDRILRCPADTQVQVVSWLGAGKYRRTYALNRTADYGINTATAHYPGRGITNTNSQLVGGAFMYSGNPQYKLTDVRTSAETMLLSEAPVDQNVIGYGGLGVIDAPTSQLQQVSEGLHHGKFNYLFCDGHVALFNPLETVGAGSMGNPKGMWTRADD